MYVSPDAQLKYLKPGSTGFDKSLLNIVSRYIKPTPTPTVWDVGANVGVFSIAAASVAPKGEVLAIEADSWLLIIISKSVKLKCNKNLNITTLTAMVSDSNEIAQFSIAERGRAANSLSSVGGRSQAGGQEKLN